MVHEKKFLLSLSRNFAIFFIEIPRNSAKYHETIGTKFHEMLFMKFREIFSKISRNYGTKFHEISRNKFYFRIKFRISRSRKIDFRIHYPPYTACIFIFLRSKAVSPMNVTFRSYSNISICMRCQMQMIIFLSLFIYSKRLVLYIL
jgi:hypothetical protein